MMDEWPDYFITHKRFDKDRTRIEKVLVSDSFLLLESCVGEKDVDPKSVFDRSEVVELIEKKGKVFRTFYEDYPNHWTVGEKVHLYRTDDDVFIRTDKNEEAKDNLGELPEF